MSALSNVLIINAYSRWNFCWIENIDIAHTYSDIATVAANLTIACQKWKNYQRKVTTVVTVQANR